MNYPLKKNNFMNQNEKRNSPFKILHLEDSPQDAELIRELLIYEKLDLSIDLIEKEQEFTALLRGNQYDLILADFKLPGFDAFGALKWANEICPEVPFICVSGAIGEEAAVRLIRQGAVDYVMKDRLQRLSSAIERALNEAEEKELRKQAEKALKESEKKFRSIIEYSADAIFITKPSGDYVYVNQTASDLLGYAPEKLLTMSISDLSSPDEIKQNVENFNKLQIDGHLFSEISLKRADGFFVLVDLNAVLLPNGLTYGSCRDISKRKQAEEDLTRSEERLRILFECAPDAYYLSDKKGTFIDGNKAAVDLLGYRKEELIGRSFLKLKLLTGKELLKASKLLLKNVQGKGTGPDEFILNRKDGSQISAEIRTFPVKIKGKTLVLGIARDITARKNAEDELRKNLVSLQQSESIAQLGYFERNWQTGEAYWSPGFFHLLGLEDVTESPDHEDFMDYIHKDDRVRVTEHIQETIREHKSMDINFRLVRPNGQILHIHGIADNYYDGDGKPLLTKGTFQNITDQQESADKMKKSEARYRELFDQSNDSIVFTSFKGSIIDINSAGLELFGYPKEEILSLTVLDLYANPEWRQDFLKQIEKNGFVKNMDLQVQRKNGGVLDCLISSFRTRIASDEKSYYISTITDVTDLYKTRKRLESALLKSQSAEQGLEKTMITLRRALIGIIMAMSRTVEQRDPYTAGHQNRVSNLAVGIAVEMGLSGEVVEGIKMAGIIHDIGKIAVPSDILSKPSILTEHEFAIIKDHSQVGFDILKDIEFPWPIATIILQHHEYLDGSGYPNGILGDEILLESRILTVADIVEAMVSHRPYRPAHAIDIALEEIEKHKGTKLDADVVDVCIKLFHEKDFHIE